ncbi:MAG: hypothetical protein R3A10_18735 [Caldilineaceae bacterium]
MATSKKQREQEQATVQQEHVAQLRRSVQRQGHGAAASTAATAESAAPSVRDANWGTEYAYVLGDLRQLFLVSLVVIVLMIVVGFLI